MAVERDCVTLYLPGQLVLEVPGGGSFLSHLAGGEVGISGGSGTPQ